MQNTLLSVIIPAHNIANYLSQSIESALEQGVDRLEILVVNDGSTDDTAALAARYAGGDRRVRVIDMEHRGVSAARNRGVDEARGEYVLFLDADDFLLPATLKPLLQMAGKHKLDLLGYAHCHVSPDAKPSDFQTADIDPEQPLHIVDAPRFVEQYNTPGQAWWYLVRRDTLLKSGARFPEGHLLEEAGYNFRLFLACRRLAMRGTTAYAYRNRPDSAMHSNDEEHGIRLLGDYIYAAQDVKCLLHDCGDKYTEKGYRRWESHWRNYVFFGAIRAMKYGRTREYIAQAREAGVYPFERMYREHYPGLKLTLLHKAINTPWLWNMISSLYRKIR